MYRMIGADGREYGPASAEQVRQWIAEGRANAQTHIQAAGSTAWLSLAETPEFADLYRVPPPVSPAPAAPAVFPSADKKIAAGICGVILGGLGIHKFILGYTGVGMTMLLISILTCGVGYPVMQIIGFIEGILYLTKSDEDFVNTYVIRKKGWF